MIVQPRCCPEPRCSPLHQVNGDAMDEPGQSWFCFGQGDRETVFVYDGVEHSNDLNACTYTPLKGVIRFQENAQDWFLMAHAYAMALWKLGGCQGDAPPMPWDLIKAVEKR